LLLEGGNTRWFVILAHCFERFIRLNCSLHDVMTMRTQQAKTIITPIKHSVAIYRVDRDTANTISEAWLQARRFFDSLDKTSFHRVVKGHLHGFYTPSEAKQLYRAFCGSSLQPWPSDEFRNASKEVADKLHKLLLACHNEMIQRSFNDKDEDERPLKRLKTTTFTIPESARETDACPLDYFLYNGDKPNAVSCSEHVDRGILICVCLTNVPGLEVLPRDQDAFFCPEIHTHNENLYRDRQACSGLVCIMAGDQLKEMHPQVKACVHRVRNDLKQSRLSITYELRATLS